MTSPDPIGVEPTVRAYAESLGAPGRHWLSALPGLVDQCCRDWALRRGRVLPGGSRSLVCRVIDAEGRPAVLKLALPEPILATQMATLVAARGRGYVQVLAHDLSRGALLLESLGPPIPEGSADVPAVLDLTAAALIQAWQVPHAGFSASAGAAGHKAAGLYHLIRDFAADAGTALQPVVEQALSCAQQRLEARDPARQVVVHGDPHVGNLLPVERPRPGAGAGHVFVDPEGFLCEPEYDLGVAVRGWTEHLLAAGQPSVLLRAWCEQLAQATGTDAEAVWQWAFLERVSTGLYLCHHGLPQLGAPFLEVAGRLLE